MNKKVIFLGLSVMVIAVSCKFLKKNETVSEAENELAGNLVPIYSSELLVGTPLPPAQPAPQTPSPSAPTPASPSRAITQYDSQKLDQEVREEALKMGKDPATYRKIVRIDPDGTTIYRQIGMHVIVTPNNETVFLPDEI